MNPNKIFTEQTVRIIVDLTLDPVYTRFSNRIVHVSGYTGAGMTAVLAKLPQNMQQSWVQCNLPTVQKCGVWVWTGTLRMNVISGLVETATGTWKPWALDDYAKWSQT